MAQRPPLPEDLASRPDATPETGISRARKVRFILLLVLLVCLAGATAVRSVRQRRKEARHREAVAELLGEFRQAVGGLDPSLPQAVLAGRLSEAGRLWGDVQDLDPGNVEANRLAVALFYARASLGKAIELFNELPVKALASEHAEKATTGAMRTVYGKATRAVLSFQIRHTGPTDEEMGAEDEEYLRGTGFVWGLARITATGASDTERALSLCDWVALHLRPVPEDDMPADPYMVLLRGYGSPEQITWAYAELARQAGLRCKVAVLQPSEAEEAHYLVEVYPADGPPFLVSPHLGVPVLDVGSGARLSLSDLSEKPEAYGQLLALAASSGSWGTGAGGNDAERRADSAGAAELKLPVHPYACFPRFLVLDYLLSALPAHPRVSIDGSDVGNDEQIVLWEFPVAAVEEMASARYAEQMADRYVALRMLLRPRTLQLQGLLYAADDGYRAAAADLTAKEAQAEVDRTRAVLREAIEDVAFFRVETAHSAGAWGLAADRARDYLAAYPDGRWSLAATALQADALAAEGDEGADALWGQLAGPRKLYGVLRARGLLPVRPTERATQAQAPGTPSSP